MWQEVKKYMEKEEKFLNRKEIIKKHETSLLADLLFFSYMNDTNFNIDYVFNEMKDSINYTDEEEKEIVGSALNIVKERYGVDITNKMD